MNQISIQHYKSPFGELIIGSFDNKLCLCDWRYRKMRPQIDMRITKGLSAEYIEKSDPIIDQTKTQIEEYSQGNREEFDIPLMLIGSNFQKTVWNELLKVPYGQTLSYLELSNQLNKQLAIRAVASANGANAISIIVPCHRIVGSKGELTGYAGGIHVKQKLLRLESPINHPTQLNIFNT